MLRNIYKTLLSWKDDPNKKPLLIKGARQVGKTYILKEFGQREFQKCHHFDFTKNKALKTVFEGDLDPLKIIRKIEIQFEVSIDAGNDLIIFDEIQDCPSALTSLKYFCDHSQSFFIVASGSFLGVSLSTDSYPVGKIKTLTLHPMTYDEFLIGMERHALYEEICDGTTRNQIDPSIHAKAFEYLKYYFITGGLPEVVQKFKDGFDDLPQTLGGVRELQNEIIDHYLNDMAKHCGKVHAVKIQTVFENIPLQLARESIPHHKFVFKDVLPGRSNFQILADPISWLIKSNLVHQIPLCKKADSPLKAFTDHNKFKLYLFDVGILGAMVGLKPKDILNYDYGSYKGYFAENYVIQELNASGYQQLYSWREGTSEIELLVEFNSGITPIEVKAGINSKAKSLTVFTQRYSPQKSYLISANPISLKETGKSYLPLYAVSKIGP